MLRVVRTAFMLAVISGSAAFVAVPVAAASDEPELFMTHVRFEALRSVRRKAVDPQVFMREKEGYRPARRGDDPSLPLYTAHGEALSLNLGHWFGASGTAQFLNGPGGPVREVRFSFDGLVPFGVYSIFVSRSTPDTIEIVPFAKTTESLKASIDGSVVLTASAEIPLLDGDLIWLVYHSDGVAHGNRLGELGVTAHEQLVLPIQLSSPAKPPSPTPSPPPPPSPTPFLSPSPSPSPFPTLPPQPVTMVNQSDATPPSGTVTAPPSTDDDDLYVPLDSAGTPAPTGQPSPAPPVPQGASAPLTPAPPAESATPTESATPAESSSPAESPSPMTTEPTF